MSKKDQQILELTAELARITNDRDAKTKRMWQLGQEADKLQATVDQHKTEVRELAAQVVKLIQERDTALAAKKDWHHFADAEKALRIRYRNLLSTLIPLFLQMKAAQDTSLQFGELAGALAEEIKETIDAV